VKNRQIHWLVLPPTHSTNYICSQTVVAIATSKNRIRRDPIKRESKRFHSTWVKQRVVATKDAVEMAGEIAVVVEATVGTLQLPCPTRH
jgi:hypothetical protein